MNLSIKYYNKSKMYWKKISIDCLKVVYDILDNSVTIISPNPKEELTIIINECKPVITNTFYNDNYCSVKFTKDCEVKVR